MTQPVFTMRRLPEDAPQQVSCGRDAGVGAAYLGTCHLLLRARSRSDGVG